MNMKKLGMAAGLAFGLAMSFTSAVSAQTVEEFYKGKTLTLIVSAPAGTLTDFVARQFGDYYAKNIPGQPEVVVMNVAGAGGMVAASDLMLKQPKDGTAIAFLQRNNLYVPLVDDDHSKFDPREVEWIGSLDKIAYTIITTEQSGIATTEDLLGKKVILGATGYANENRTIPALVSEATNAQFEMIHGYSGRGEVYLAMERGEVDGWASTLAGISRGEEAQMVADGRLKVLLHLGWTSPAPFENVPNLSAYITDEATKSLIDFFVLPFEAGRPIAVPAGVPEDRVAALREAFDTTVSDPAFIEHMNGQDFPVDPISGDSVEVIVEKLYATPAEVVGQVRKVVTPPQ